MSAIDRPKALRLALTVFVWLAAVGAGTAMVMRHQFTPGVASAATAWPVQKTLPLAKDRLTLVMFVHPNCPCSVASMDELNHLLAVCKDRLAVDVVFFVPHDKADQLKTESLWQQASALPNVHLIADIDGAIINRFDAHTSGQVLLFDPKGRIEFSGGITSSRGHEGDNDGVDAIVARVNSITYFPADSKTTPVYGCAIAQENR